MVNETSRQCRILLSIISTGSNEHATERKHLNLRVTLLGWGAKPQPDPARLDRVTHTLLVLSRLASWEQKQNCAREATLRNSQVFVPMWVTLLDRKTLLQGASAAAKSSSAVGVCLEMDHASTIACSFCPPSSLLATVMYIHVSWQDPRCRLGDSGTLVSSASEAK